MELETGEKNLISEGADVIGNRLTDPQISDGKAGQLSEQVIERSQYKKIVFVWR